MIIPPLIKIDNLTCVIVHDNLTCVRGYCSIFGAPMNRPLGDNNIFVGILINVIPYYLRFYYPQIIVPLIAYIGLLYNFPQKENVLFEQLEQCRCQNVVFPQNNRPLARYGLIW